MPDFIWGDGIPNLLLNASQEIRFLRVLTSRFMPTYRRTTNLSRVHATSAVQSVTNSNRAAK